MVSYLHVLVSVSLQVYMVLLGAETEGQPSLNNNTKLALRTQGTDGLFNETFPNICSHLG